MTLPYAPIMWALTMLLFGRVIGQLIVFFRAPGWLPPMEQWQSGLVPYPFLVSVQVVVLGLMASISYDYTRESGFWWDAHPKLGVVVLWWSYVYLAAMIVRYVVRMTRRPDQRWLGGTIPIVFHSFVAIFQWCFAVHHVGLQ